MIEIPISTKRMTIRRFELRDAECYLRFMLDEESTRFLAFDADQKTESGARALLDYVISSYKSDAPVHAYAIAEATTDEYLGSCGFTPYSDDSVECYYCINSDHRGQHLATEALNALIQSLTAHVEVRAYCHPNNVAAHAVARNCAMSHVGIAHNKNSDLDGDLFVHPKLG